MTNQKLTVDTFYTKTFDGVPVELLSAQQLPYITIYICGLIRHKISKDLPTMEGFKLFNEAFVLTYRELRTILDI